MLYKSKGINQIIPLCFVIFTYHLQIGYFMLRYARYKCNNFMCIPSVIIYVVYSGGDLGNVSIYRPSFYVWEIRHESWNVLFS